uniref:hypothetical protein n=1 Tax=Alistipes sp. TaxID=1872444 RepID=UPI004057302A
MNFLKNILRMAMVAFAAIAVTACEPNGEQGEGSNITFSVDVDNITATSAKIKVTHDGKTSDSWYGLLTTDTSTREDRLVEETVANLKQGDLGAQLVFSKNLTKILAPLTPNTTYKYIAFGLTEDGVVYGERASIEFTTLSSSGGGNNDGAEDEVYDQMLPNPAWNIAYTGAGTINDTDYKHIVTVNSTDNNPYTIAVVYSREYDASKLRDLGTALVDSMNSYLESYNSYYGTSLVLSDILYRGNGSTAFDDLDPGYYIAVAIGITSKGKVSGLYAVSNTFEIEEETPTSLYSAWLGDWVLKGDNKVSNAVVIGRKVANKSVNLIGLGGLSFAAVGEYSTDRNDIIFSAQIVEQNYEFSDGSVGDVILVGLDEQGKFYGLNNGNYGIAIAGVLENGRYAIARYGVNQPNYTKFVAMCYVAMVDGKYYSLGKDEDIPTFSGIAELAPADAATNSVVPMRYSLGTSRTLLPKRALSLGKEIIPSTF